MSVVDEEPADSVSEQAAKRPSKPRPKAPPLPKEIGGAEGPEPTRYGDWQHKGRVTDF